MSALADSLVQWDYWMNDFPDEPIVWTRANLKDQAPRPLTPLTQDLIQTFEPEGMLRAFSDVFGLVAREELGRHITGFYGALYLSVPNSAILGDKTPGSSAHIKFEQFFGLTRAPGWTPPAPTLAASAELERKRRFEAEIERVSSVIPGAIDKLYSAIANLRPSRGWDEVSWAELHDWLTQLDDQQANSFALLVEAANVASLAYAKAGAALNARGADPDGSLLSALHVGLGGNESADMGSAVAALAQAAERDPAGLAELQSSDGVVTESLRTVHADFARLVDEFLMRFGHRGPGELMLERSSWRADPAALTRIIGRGAGGGAVRGDVNLNARLELARRLGGSIPGDIHQLLAYSQSVMASRENAKNPVVKLFDEMRILVDVASRRLLAAGKVLAVDDLLFLSHDELHAALDAQAVPSPHEIARRRSAYIDCLELELPEIVESLPNGTLRGPRPEYFESLGFLPPGDAVASPTERQSTLTGIGASPGVVVGRARVMSDALDDFEPGEILIAETVDPGWSPILAAAAAVVLDIGGRLSHGAVVARELGVPCVVNTKIAASTFETGQLIRVDGAAGTVADGE